MHFISKNKCILLILAAICFIGPLMNGFFALKACGGMHSPYYFIGYETGFGGRKLLGTVFNYLLPEYVHHRHLIPYILGVIILNAILFIKLSYTSLTRNKDKYSTIALMLFLTIYLVSPFSFLRMTSHLVWYADIWLYLASLLFLLLYVNNRKTWWYWPTTLIIAISACLTHHIFCCMFFPMFAALFVYDTINESSVNTKRGVGYFIICIALVALFLVIWFWGDSNMDIDAIYDNVSRRTNCVCTKERIYFHWLYGTNAENIQAMWDVGQFPWRYYQFSPVIILISPLIILFCAPWVMAIRSTPKGIVRTKYTIMFLLPTLLILPLFVVATDYSRWFYAWFFCQTMLLLVMHALNDIIIDTQLHRMLLFLKKHWATALLLIIYCCSFGIGACGINWMELVPSLF